MAPSVSTSYPAPHNQHLSFQKYLILQSQHESLLEQVDRILSCAGPAALSSAATSPSVSPTRAETFPTKRRHSRTDRRPSMPPSDHTSGSFRSREGSLETILDESTLSILAADQRRLLDVNEGIKRALTELLNCEAVRNDQSSRAWVQTRLMETEKELRSGRRRRSSVMLD